MYIVLIVILAVILIIVITGLKINQRNRRLIHWANALPLSENQLEVLRILAEAESKHEVPAKDPISLLTEEERGELLYLCSPSGPPQKLAPGGERWWVVFVLRAKKMGFNEDQSMILAGMDYCRLHPKYRKNVQKSF